MRRGAGVRASIVALKPGNAGGAKGGRKVEMDQAERRTELPGLVLLLLHVAGEAEALARSQAELSFRARQMLMAFIVEVVENRLDPASLHWLRQPSLSLVVGWAVRDRKSVV